MGGSVLWPRLLLIFFPLHVLATTAIYPSYPEPMDNPDKARHATQPPPPSVFPRGRTRFSGYRGGCSADEFDAYAEAKLGDVWWPQYPVLQQNATDLAACFALVKAHGLAMVDVSNYVPGDMATCSPVPPAGVCEYHLPDATRRQLEDALGDSWTGMDNGEQDGRYTGAYANQLTGGGAASHASQRLNFLRHFQRMTDDLGGKIMALNSLYFTHEFARTGLYTGMGAETAQGLPNAQLFMAFLRGAMKAFGTLLWGNVSIYNRFGFKSCTKTGCSASGTSLSLMKRLMVAQLQYGVSFFGFEGALQDGSAALTPIGRMQAAAAAMPRWKPPKAGSGVGASASASASAREGAPGAAPCTFLSTVALVLDVEAGWAPPRHLYSADLYRVWGNKPYGRADHFTHGVLDLLYPSYADSSYFHSERGFSTPTPFGDVLDVLQTDAPTWLLGRYAVLLFAGAATRSGILGAEVAAKIEQVVAGGGGGGPTVVLAADSLASLADAADAGNVLGVAVDRDGGHPAVVVKVAAGDVVTCGGEKITEPVSLDLVALKILPGTESEVLCATAAGVPAVIRVRTGGAGSRGGSLVVLASDGISAALDPGVKLPLQSSVDRALPAPFPLARHVSHVLATLFEQEATTIKAANSTLLTSTTCRREPGKYTVAVSNPNLAEAPLGAFVSGVGPVGTVDEVPLDNSEKDSRGGYLPGGFENASIGNSTATTIAGGDTRLFDVTLEHETAELLPTGTPAELPRGQRHVALPLPLLSTLGASLADEIRLRPSFFQHYDTVLVPFAWVEDTEPAALQREDAWAASQGLRIVVDIASSLNLYPDLRLCNNSKSEFAGSLARIEGVLAKVVEHMPRGSCTDVVLGFHRAPENYYSMESCQADWRSVLSRLDKVVMEHSAAARKGGTNAGITVHLKVDRVKPPHTVEEAWGYVSGLSPQRWAIAPSVALLQDENNVTTAEALTAFLKGHGISPRSIGLWFAGAPVRDPLVPQTLLSTRGSLQAHKESAAAAAALAGATPWAAGMVVDSLDDAAARRGEHGGGSFAQRTNTEFREANAVEEKVHAAGLV